MLLTSGGGMSDVYECMRAPKALTHTLIYGTANEAEHMLIVAFC